MKKYMLLACLLLIFNQTPTKCTQNIEELTQEEIESMLTNNCEGNPFAIDRSQATLPMKKRKMKVGNDKQSISIEKKRKKYLEYHVAQPHKREMTAEFEALLTEKERVLKSDTDYKWEDLYQYPLDNYQKYWDDFCGQLWTGLPEHSVPGYIGDKKKFCVASFFLMDIIHSKTYFKGFRHDYDPEVEKDVWPFAADFMSCDCKNIQAGRSNRAIPRTRRYFFAMKIDENEYFLLTKVDKVKEKSMAQTGYLLKIADYVNLLETEKIPKLPLV